MSQQYTLSHAPSTAHPDIKQRAIGHWEVREDSWTAGPSQAEPAGAWRVFIFQFLYCTLFLYNTFKMEGSVFAGIWLDQWSQSKEISFHSVGTNGTLNLAEKKRTEIRCLSTIAFILMACWIRYLCNTFSIKIIPKNLGDASPSQSPRLTFSPSTFLILPAPLQPCFHFAQWKPVVLQRKIPFLAKKHLSSSWKRSHHN